MSRHSFIEGLESRTLMSAAPVLFNHPITVDRLHVKIDLLEFQLDVARNKTKLTADQHKIHRETPAGDTTLVAPLAALAAFNTTLQATLKADRLAESAAAVTDEATIKLDIIQIKMDKGNAGAETTDHNKLKADRATLQGDLIAGLDARISARTTAEATISADTLAIVTANAADTAKTAGLTAAVAKFSSDRVACLDKLTGDLTKIMTARNKLQTDLIAAETT